MSDTEVLAEANEKIIPYGDFSDCLSSISVDLEPRQFLLKWKTVHRLFIDPTEAKENELDEYDWFDNLLHLALGDLEKEPALAEYLCAELKKDDVMYSNSNGKNNEELQVLSTYCLRLLIDENIWSSDFTSSCMLKIQAASLNGMKKFKGGIDLLSFVANERFSSSRGLRDRKKINSPSSYFKKSANFETAFNELNESPTHPPYNTSAIQALNKELFSQLFHTQNSLKYFTSSLDDEMEKLSEEQEVLWFVTVAWSERYNKAYSELSIEQRILDCTLELANRTLVKAELPSIKGLAAKLGIANEEITFSQIIDTISKDETVNLSDYYHKATKVVPVLYALNLASNGNWKSKWKSAINVDYNFKLDARSFALQLYRELLALKWSRVE